MPQWNGQWPGGRTYLDRHGNTRWQLERMHNGARYSRRLEARNETEALAELALFDRDPDAYLTKSQAARKAADEAVLMDAELVGRFLAYLKAEGRTERYRCNMRTYLAQWAEALAGRDLRHVTLQELKRELAKRPNAKKHRIIALKSFFSFLREVEAVITPAQDASLGLKVPPARPEKARRSKGYSMTEVEVFYKAISGWESPKLGGMKTDVQAVKDLVVLHAKTGMHRSEPAPVASGIGARGDEPPPATPPGQGREHHRWCWWGGGHASPPSIFTARGASPPAGARPARSRWPLPPGG